MAINPNVDFLAGAVLTASQQNRFPRGVMAASTVTASVSSAFNVEITLASVSFTAVANRNYKISFACGNYSNASGNVIQQTNFRLDTTGGTLLTQAENFLVATQGLSLNMFYVGTFSAGTRTIFARGLNTTTASATIYNAASARPMQLVVEDIGPA